KELIDIIKIKGENKLDEFDDFIDEIKKKFKINSDTFDIDFLFLPESESGLNLKPKEDKVKGFKISYHFESGMEKPEIKVKGNIDKNHIRDYLKNIDESKYPYLKKFFDSKSVNELDAKNLSLDIPDRNLNLSILEPQAEINDYKDHIEIVFEIPGMIEEDVAIEFKEGGSTIYFIAENENRMYEKSLILPFKANFENYDLKVKNGLAIVNIKK
ncbi:MAG: hypothetical protein ACFE9Z_13045, partial [Promethearchaeota archaeon]